MINNLYIMKNNKNKGQIVLILVLITVVGLTIGLSLISRTITDIRISSQIEQSSRAFSAAEAGIETALRGNVEIGPTGTVSLEGASANYSVSTVGGTDANYNLSLTEVGNSQTVWLVEHNADDSINESGYSYPVSSTLEVCFGTRPDSNGAVLVSIFYKDGTDYKMAKKAIDSSVRDNGFIIADVLGNYCGGQFRFRKIIMPSTDANSNTNDFNISPSAILLFLRLQPLYEASAITIDPQSILPVQGRIISSIGQTATGVARKIQVYQGYPVLPSLLDFSFFTEN